MVEEFQYPKEPIMDPPDEIVAVAEFDTDIFRNLDEVAEFHDDAFQFPQDEEPKIVKTKAGEDKAALEMVKNYSNSMVAPEAVLATAAVAVIATAAFIIPIIESADMQVDFNVTFVNGVLSYSIELYDPAENEQYYLYVLEGDTVVQYSRITDNRISGTLDGLLPYKDHILEIRSGSPPLYVVCGYTIPAAEIWADWGYLEPDYNVIDYSVILFGESDNAVIGLYDPELETDVYAMKLIEGLNTGIITGLEASHTYVAYVSVDSKRYLTKEVDTLTPDVYWEYLNVKGLTVEYGINVFEGEEALKISMHDSATAQILYTADLIVGDNTGTITGLERGHTYVISVFSQSWTYLTEQIVIEPEPIIVTLGHIKVDMNSVEYEVTVVGDTTTATAYLVNSRTGATVYTAVLPVGTTTDTIKNLEFGQAYEFKVTSPKETYITENVNIELEPTSVVLEKLEMVNGNAIEYELVVAGGKDSPKIYLYDTDDGSLVHTEGLSVGFNSGTIPDLEYGHEYEFKVSSDTKTYVEEKLSSDEKYRLNYFVQYDRTLKYSFVLNDSAQAALSIYGVYEDDGPEYLIWHRGEIMANELVEGVVDKDEDDYDLSFHATYTLKLELDDELIELGSIDFNTATINYVRLNNLDIEYSVTYHMSTIGANLEIHDYAYGGLLREIELHEGENVGTVSGVATYGSDIHVIVNPDIGGEGWVVYPGENDPPIEVPFPATFYGVLSESPGTLTCEIWIDTNAFGSSSSIGLSLLYQDPESGTIERYSVVDTSGAHPDGNGMITGMFNVTGPDYGIFNRAELQIGTLHSTYEIYVIVSTP